ncbi:MAG: arsenate reductase (glutaredoxin) [Flavobacteriaceae bacterium]|nr:MAG: arsenate reductase (glutaredoxin) [Flavobacteriaceae bacterium]
MYKLYHNPKCSTSRKAKHLLEEKNVSFTEVLYLKNPLSSSEIKELLLKLNLSAMEVIRKKESLWKENFADKNLSQEELIEILAQNPSLLERPILETDAKALVGRPTEVLLELIS